MEEHCPVLHRVPLVRLRVDLSRVSSFSIEAAINSQELPCVFLLFLASAFWDSDKLDIIIIICSKQQTLLLLPPMDFSLFALECSHRCRFSLLFFISYFISFQFKYAHLFNIWSTFAVVEAVVLFTNLSGRVRVVPLSCFHTIYVGRVLLLLLLLAYLQRVQTTGGRLLAKFYTFNGRPRVEQQSRTAPQGRRRRLKWTLKGRCGCWGSPSHSQRTAVQCSAQFNDDATGRDGTRRDPSNGQWDAHLLL